MKTRRFILLLIALALGTLLLTQTALAHTGDGWDLTWNVVGGGGHPQPLSGSGFSVESTIGQTAVGSSSGSGFTLDHGYWLAKFLTKVNIPIVLKR